MHKKLKSSLTLFLAILTLVFYCPLTANGQETPVNYYKQAKKKMTDDMYLIYRTAERIIRANKLDDYPWLISLPNEREYKIQAKTTEATSIILDKGLLYTCSDDVSSLAFVIGHEMAHQIQKHLRQKGRQFILLQEHIDKMKEKIKKDQEQMEEHVHIFTKVLNPWYLANLRRKIRQQRKEIEKLQKQLDADILAFSRKKEYEADRLGLEYIIKAGFDPNGAIKIAKLFERFPQGDQEKSTHPDAKNRLWQIQTNIKNSDIQNLKQQGQKNIKNSLPLAFEIKKYYQTKHILKQRSLLIHTKHYRENDINQQFEKLFGY